MADMIRAKAYFLSHRMLLGILNSHRYADGRHLVIQVSEPLGLPDDAYISGVHYSPLRQGYECLVESESFPEIDISSGAEIPIHDQFSMDLKAYHVINEFVIRREWDFKSLPADELRLIRQAIDEAIYDQERGK